MNKWARMDSRMKEWLWSLLPDKCQMPRCTRHGIRGNENRVTMPNGEVRIMCDNCTFKHLDQTKEPS